MIHNDKYKFVAVINEKFVGIVYVKEDVYG